MPDAAVSCGLCGADLMPDGELAKCTQTRSGYHLTSVAMLHMTQQQIREHQQAAETPHRRGRRRLAT